MKLYLSTDADHRTNIFLFFLIENFLGGPPPPQGPSQGCEEDLSNERKGLFHRGHTDVHTYIQTDGHRNSMTESAQWANSVKRKIPEMPKMPMCIMSV